ncbi:uncharacterized protein LOC115621176 [Scaptodrosophila lebanonensis]|uniref:Uncharacterized protein LOC115621176 n=1 Tax=Drosophila lebanonensis TaxID=7225 RepID=A0A6J2T5P8_DROLE|nr:uncharacterized protein LOC115621176 [Scaptodrosophila lebanonensis]
MKPQVVICISFVVALGALTSAYNGDGQPGCRTQEEVDIGIFRDNWDATSYWKCEKLNEPASRWRCPSETGFMDSLKDCVNWDEWKWEKPAAPLSEVVDE